MKKTAYAGALFVILALAALMVGGAVKADSSAVEALPTNVVYLDKGPGTFNTSLEEFVDLLPIIYNGESAPEPDPTATDPPPPTATDPPPPTATDPPPSNFTLTCDPVYEINIVDEEVHFQFAATAYENGAPLEDVDLMGTLDTGSQTPSNVENTNPNGVADFTITVLVGTITQTPMATVTFNDQATYGNASCTVDFSEAVPTPTPPPAFDVACSEDTEINIIDEEVKFKFAATALNNGNPVSDVDLKGTLDVGAQTPSTNVEPTGLNGEADFTITVLIGTITKTPLATVTYADQGTFGTASCTVDFSGADIDWISLAASNKNNP